jgi:hypothetical protein
MKPFKVLIAMLLLCYFFWSSFRLTDKVCDSIREWHQISYLKGLCELCFFCDCVEWTKQKKKKKNLDAVSEASSSEESEQSLWKLFVSSVEGLKKNIFVIFRRSCICVTVKDICVLLLASCILYPFNIRIKHILEICSKIIIYNVKELWETHYTCSWTLETNSSSWTGPSLELAISLLGAPHEEIVSIVNLECNLY